MGRGRAASDATRKRVTGARARLTPDTARHGAQPLLDDAGYRTAAPDISAEIDAMPTPVTVVELLHRRARHR
jgi:hypothetical protein